MSVSSATTLISPATTTSHTTMQRSNSQHGHKRHHAHAHHGHGHTKRRPSAHAAHTTGHLGTGRRGSEGDGGRKAILHGLTMHTMDGKGKKAEERPGAKSSRSDTSVLKMRRTMSVTSNSSSNHGTTSRPRLKEKDSENSVVVVDDDGQEHEVEGGAEEDEEWDDEETPSKGKGHAQASKQEVKEKRVDQDQDLMSQAMRRTMSASAAATTTQSPEEMSVKPASITSPVSTSKLRPEASSHMTRKTTGFNDPHHEPSPEPQPEPVPLKRVQSVKELAQEAIGSERRATQEKLAMTGQSGHQRSGSGATDHSHNHRSDPAPPTRTRSTEGSGMPRAPEVETSPSYPFPRVLDSQGPERKTSGLRHAPSSTSLRSNVSYRAPPHPLNSNIGYHAGNHARTASTALTIDSDMRRTMHQPPALLPVVNTEAAAGQAYESPETKSDYHPTPQMSRRESSSSQRSLLAIFQPTSSRMQPTGKTSSNGAGSSSQGPIPNRRPTAMEAAAAASKLHTTNDPARYHQSLGYSTQSAETAHLISRFLPPPKRSCKPSWIIGADHGPNDVGINESEYREAHDALLRQMKTMGVPAPSMSRSNTSTMGLGGLGMTARKASRFGTLLHPNYARESAVGMVKSKNGPLQVSRGGWKGRTPFELGLERCLAQRPRTAGM